MPQTSTDIRFASALSTAPTSAAAVQQIIAELRDRIEPPIDLLMLFVTVEHRAQMPQIRDRLRAALQPNTLIGTTCSGVVGVGREVESGPGMSVLAARIPNAVIQPFAHEQAQWTRLLMTPPLLRNSIQFAFTPQEPPKAIVLIPDPFSTPMVKLLPAFAEAFPGVPVIGGMASSGRQPRQNRLLLNDSLINSGAVGFTLAGHVDVRTTVSQGCRPVGQPWVITRAQQHVVQELGGRNALRVVQEMVEDFDDYDQQLVQSAGLLVGRVIDEYKSYFGRGDFVIRGLAGVDPDAGYLAIGDPQVRVGQTVQFHLRDQQTAAQDLAMLLDAQRLHGPSAGALLFTCGGRGTKLFDRPDTDATLIAQALGDVPLAGFFAAGELGPIGNANFVHGHTASLLAFRDPAAAGKTVIDGLTD